MDRIEKLQERYLQLLRQIEWEAKRVGRVIPPALCVVSKGASTDQIAALYEVGCRDFGESRLEALQLKQADLPGREKLRWHFIGNLQSRKLKELLICTPYYIHSVPNLTLLQKLDQRAQELKQIARLFLQVNVTGELSKQGDSPAQWYGQLPKVAALSHLQISGLMTIAPRGADPLLLESTFTQLAQLRQQWQLPGCSELSMGMSQDWRVAISCGSTWLRVGTALFEAL